MNDIFKQLEELTKRDLADPAWLAQNRRQLHAYMLMHPRQTPTRSFLTRHLFHTIPAVALAVLVLMISAGGVTLAAQSTLPGDFLYSWKVGVVESIESAFVVGTQQRADFEVARTTKRLTEITELAVRKEIDAQTTAEARTRLEGQIQVAADQIAKAAVENKEKALATAVELNATLQAHKDVLNQLQPKVGSDVQPQVQGVITTIEKTVTGVAQTVQDLKQQTKQESVTTKSDVDLKEDAAGKLDAAKKKLDGVWALVATLDESSALRIEAERKLIFAQDAISAGDEDFRQQQYADVISDVQSANQFISDTAALLMATSSASVTVKQILEPVPTSTSTPAPTLASSSSSVVR